MHDLAVRNYCKLQVDWDIAQETKDYNAMAQLKQPLKDARTDAKLNPNQFKAADFQNSGANSFGEITRLVAKRDVSSCYPSYNRYLFSQLWFGIN